MLQSVIDRRSIYRGFKDKIIALRRHPESGSSVVHVGTDYWLRNWRCDVYSVDPNWEERLQIRAGDVVWVNPLDGLQIDQAADPMLLSIQTTDEWGEHGVTYKGVLAIDRCADLAENEEYIAKSGDTGYFPEYRGIQLDHIFTDTDSSDIAEVWYPKGAWMITQICPLTKLTTRKFVLKEEEFHARFHVESEEQLGYAEG